VPAHADPYGAIDRQPDPEHYITFLETRGATPDQVRLRRRFLRFCGVRPGWRVLEVGSGTGVLTRDIAAQVGPSGRVVGVDPSRVLISAARRLARDHRPDSRIDFRVGDGARLAFPGNRFDCALAMTVLLHVPNSAAIVGELARVTKAGGIVGVQDQDLGALVLDHPDRALTRRILDGVAARTVVDPWSGRSLVGKLIAAGLTRVRLMTEVFQDTTYTAFTRIMLERRAERRALRDHGRAGGFTVDPGPRAPGRGGALRDDAQFLWSSGNQAGHPGTLQIGDDDMPRVTEIEDDGGDPTLKEIFAKEREFFGAVLNTTKVYAHCPPILKAAKQLSASIERSGLLPASLLPLVYLRVALINGCPF